MGTQEENSVQSGGKYANNVLSEFFGQACSGLGTISGFLHKNVGKYKASAPPLNHHSYSKSR